MTAVVDIISAVLITASLLTVGTAVILGVGWLYLLEYSNKNKE